MPEPSRKFYTIRVHCLSWENVEYVHEEKVWATSAGHAAVRVGVNLPRMRHIRQVEVVDA